LQIANGFSSADPAVAGETFRFCVAGEYRVHQSIPGVPTSSTRSRRTTHPAVALGGIPASQREWLSLPRFCERYQRCRRKQGVGCAEEHKAGKKLFVD
jgi:hypothetical protein